MRLGLLEALKSHLRDTQNSIKTLQIKKYKIDSYVKCRADKNLIYMLLLLNLDKLRILQRHDLQRAGYDVFM